MAKRSASLVLPHLRRWIWRKADKGEDQEPSLHVDVCVIFGFVYLFGWLVFVCFLR